VNGRKPTALREFSRRAAELGFAFDGITGGGHPRYRHRETGAVYTTGMTPSDVRARMNALADMEKIAGRKLPRKNAGKHRRSRVVSTSYTKTVSERVSSDRIERLLAQADRIRREWNEAVADEGRESAAVARSLMHSYEDVRRQLESMYRIIPSLYSVF
jgi:hypothetical protein